MSPRIFPSKRLVYILLVFFLVIGAVAAYRWYERHALPVGSTPAPTGTSDAGMMPDIPVPLGWSVERIDSSRLVFTHSGAATISSSGESIDVEAFKGKTSITEQIKSLGDDHTFDSAKTWNSINGRLILSAPFKEGDHTSILVYSIWSPSQIYVFSLSPYQTFDPLKKAWITIDPADLPVIEHMVEVFAPNAE
ncbi:MAG TPA: hypothetical protein VIE43_16405 [Thermoanaerobaculia bacterium]|jgi:hypothetical protein|nr:hypothetical protein [Thermoanaerobaculia bacterium]